VAQIRAQMQQVMQDVHFQGDLPAFLHFLRTDPQFYVKTPQALLDRGAWIAKEFDAKAAEWFGHLPRRRFAIVPVPDAIAPYYTAGRGGPGVYLINTFNLPSRPLYSLPALTLHESAPGHAFQMPLAAENKDLPRSDRNRTFPPMAKAGRSIARSWARTWGCIIRPTNALACSATRPGAPRGWWSTPASTRWAGAAPRRSNTCATTPPCRTTRSRPRPTAISPGPARP
jgi:hypothetical protein